MTDPYGRAWLTVTLTDRLTMGELQKIIAAMPPAWRGDDASGAYSRPSRKADILDWLRERRQRYWDTAQVRNASGQTVNSARATQQRGTTRRADLCKIPAAECNAWLRSLPPVEMEG